MKDSSYDKLLYILPIVILVVLFILISTMHLGSKKVICTKKSNQITNGYKLDNKYIIYSKDNLVTKVEVNEQVISKDKSILKEHKKEFEDQYNYNKKTFGGYTYKVTMDKKKVEAKVKIDYSKVNMKKYINYNNAMKEYTENNKVTLKGIKKMYKSMGAKCK